MKKIETVTLDVLAKLELNANELKLMLEKMGVQDFEDTTVTISKDNFMKGVAARNEIVGR